MKIRGLQARYATPLLLGTLGVLGCAALAGCSSAEDGAAGGNAADTASTGAASEWCHDSLTAEDGTTLAFDYQVAPKVVNDGEVVYSTSTSSAYLNVHRSSFTGNEQAQGVITVLQASSKTEDFTLAWGFKESVQVPLTWNGTGFTGQVPKSLPMSSYTSGSDAAGENVYQFSVVIDGTYLVDKINHSHNLQYFPILQGTDFTCQGGLNTSAPAPPSPCAQFADGNYCGGENGFPGEQNAVYVCYSHDVGVVEGCSTTCTAGKCGS